MDILRRNLQDTYRPPEGPCAISNDPAEPILPGDFYVCGVFAYRCPVNEASDVVVPLLVNYDYDIYHESSDEDSGNTFDETVSFVEERILEGLATAMQVNNCAMIGKGRRRKLLSFSDQDLQLFKGISSSPKDVKDDRYEGCFSDVELEGAECTQMKGSLQLEVLLTEEETAAGKTTISEELATSLRAVVYDYLETTMINDAYVSPGHIRKTVFVGDRLELQPINPSTSPENQAKSSSKSRLGAILGGVGGAFVLSVVMFFFVMSRRRKEPQSEKRSPTVIPVDVENDDDIYHQRKRSAKGTPSVGPGSLAFADSLALKPQKDAETTLILEDDLSKTDADYESQRDEESNSSQDQQDSPYSESVVYEDPAPPPARSFDSADYEVESQPAGLSRSGTGNVSVVSGSSDNPEAIESVLDSSLEKVLNTMRDDCCGKKSNDSYPAMDTEFYK